MSRLGTIGTLRANLFINGVRLLHRQPRRRACTRPGYGGRAARSGFPRRRPPALQTAARHDAEKLTTAASAWPTWGGSVLARDASKETLGQIARSYNVSRWKISRLMPSMA
jgi:hypothetical protein